MIEVISLALGSQVLLILGGLGLLQVASRRERIQWLPLVPFAWGIGVVILYLFGHMLVRTEWMVTGWHLAVAATLLALAAGGLWYGLRIPRGPSRVVLARPHGRDALLLALILVKVGLVTYINLVDSVIDADATHPLGYLALAKKVGEGISPSQVLGDEPIISPWGPVFLAVWVRAFLDRWHDSVAGLPWLMAYLWTLGGAFVIGQRITRNLTASLACAYLLSAIPLLVMHTIRIGFNDLPLTYFFLVGMGFLALSFVPEERPDALWKLIGVTAILGSALTKMEGKMWAFWLGAIWFSHYLKTSRGVPWSRLLAVQGGGVLVLAAIHYSIGEGFRDLGFRLDLLIPHGFDPRAFRMTLGFLFGWGSFNIWWWMFAVLAGFLLWRGPADIRALTVYALLMILCILYFANFTDNVQFTLIGTNLGRFLLQVTPVFLPLYCAAVVRLGPALAPESGDRT